MEFERGKKPVLDVDVISGDQGQRELLALLDRSFAVPQGRHFFDDFPIWDESHGAKIFRVGVSRNNGNGEEELVSSAGVRLAEMKTPTGPIKVGLVGAVATDAKWRGRGLASQTVDLAIRWAQERGAALIFLWGSEYTLYEKLGFHLCGIQARISLNDLTLPTLTGAENIGIGWTNGIFELLKSRPKGLVIDTTDQSWLQAHQSVQWYWLGSPEHPRAYVAIGRGIDLKNLVHEWGGEKTALHQLLAWVRANHPDLQILGSPSLFSEHEIGPSNQISEEYLCMARVLDPVRVFSAFNPGKPISARLTEDGWDLDISGVALHALTDASLARLFLGPERFQEIQDGLLPIDFWIWGLDGA